MAKPGSLHKNFREIKVIETDGEEYFIRSTYHNDIMKVEIDPKTHPAWTKEFGSVRSVGKVAEFAKRFAGLDFLSENKA